MTFAPRGRPAGSGRRRVAVATVLSLAVTTLVVLAVRYDGEPIHDVDLNDGSVWVTKPGMIGRLSQVLGEAGVNIAQMHNASRGELAYTLVDLDAPVTRWLPSWSPTPTRY